MKTKSLHTILKIGIGVLIGSTGLYANDVLDAKSIIDTRCTACHKGNTKDGLSRISQLRKTPEGWFMTINRMQKDHGLHLSKEEEQSVIKYLADTQGLNYEETKPFRYILERTPNYQEKPINSNLIEMCARCHSQARIGLQRRTQKEWYNLVNFHLGKFPTLEYQALSRDRDWFNIAKKDMVPYLTKTFNNDKKFKLISKNYSGTWTLFGHKLGDGDFEAQMKLAKKAKDKYSVVLNATFMDGRKFEAKGKAIVYSGYEFRASLKVGDTSYKEVFAINPKTMQLKGSMFQNLHNEEYTYISGVKNTNKKTKILGMSSNSIKAGSSKIITIVGNNLNKTISLSKGLKLNKVIKSTSNKLVLDLSASSKYKVKQVDIKIGSKQFKDKLTVYNKIDSLKVFPSYAIARVGDGGGPLPKQYANFEAIAYLAGKDGKINTKDDISLGKVDAKWNIEAFDQRAKADKDVKFAGTIDAYSGRFTPSFAGPNPKRKFKTNNAGNLKVTATYQDGANTLKANSHLIVTVQKWVNPPIN